MSGYRQHTLRQLTQRETRAGAVVIRCGRARKAAQIMDPLGVAAHAAQFVGVHLVFIRASCSGFGFGLSGGCGFGGSAPPCAAFQAV